MAKLVIASILAAKNAKKTAPKGVVMASHTCTAKKCGHTFAVQAAIESPYCVKCGSDTKRIKNNAPSQDLSSVSPNLLTDIICAGCSTHNIMHSETASTLGGTLNCVTCGISLAYSDDEGDDDLDDDMGGLDVDEDELDSSDDGDEDDAGEDDDSDDNDDAEDDDADEGDDDSDEGDDEDGDEDDGDEEESNTSTGTETGDDDVHDGYSEDDVLSDDNWDEDEGLGGDSFDDDDDSCTEVVSLLATAPRGRKRFIRHGNRVHAFVGSLCVASLAPQKATADLFDTENFLTAIKTTAVNSGFEQALSSFKFKLATVRLDKKAIARTEVASAVAKEKKRLQSNYSGDLKALKQCISMAASGFNRDMYPETGNELKATLVEVLSSLNIKNPAKVVQSAFSECADAYHANLISKAMELMSKPLEVRNELAKVLASNSLDMPEDEEDELDIESDLEDLDLEGGDDDVGDDEDDGEEASFEVRSAVTSRLAVPASRTATKGVKARSSLFPKSL